MRNEVLIGVLKAAALAALSSLVEFIQRRKS